MCLLGHPYKHTALGSTLPTFLGLVILGRNFSILILNYIQLWCFLTCAFFYSLLKILGVIGGRMCLKRSAFIFKENLFILPSSLSQIFVLSSVLKLQPLCLIIRLSSASLPTSYDSHGDRGFFGFGKLFCAAA